MKIVDPDGRDGRVVVKKKDNGGTSITIGTTVYLKSDVLNRNKLASLAKNVEFEAQRILKSKEINGVTVSFDVKYRAYTGQQLLPGDNVLTVNPYSSETSHVEQQNISDKNSTYKTAGTNGYVNADIMDSKGRSRDRGIIHETMHFLGLSDRYSGTNSSFEGFENDIMGGNARDANSMDMTHYNSYINTYGDFDMGNSSYLLLNTTIDIKGTNILKSLNNEP